MNTHSNESIENLLRRSFDGPIADNGFSERVMRLLPARRARRNWLLPVGIIAGTVACGSALASTSFVHVAIDDWASGKLSPTVLVMLATVGGMSLLASWWAMVEAE